jgi:hypothetical protein
MVEDKEVVVWSICGFGPAFCTLASSAQNSCLLRLMSDLFDKESSVEKCVNPFASLHVRQQLIKSNQTDYKLHRQHNSYNTNTNLPRASNNYR